MRRGRSWMCVALAALWISACSTDLVIGADGTLDGAAADANALDAALAEASADSAPADASARETTAADAPIDWGCGAISAAPTRYVDVRYVAGPSPFLRGGLITAGRYELVKYEVYLSGPRGTGEAAETIVVTGSPVVGAIVSVREMRNTTGLIVPVAPVGASYTFETYGSTPGIGLSQSCPRQPDSGSSTYETSATDLALYSNSSNIYRVYRRVP